MANITDKTVKSKYPPKDTNVTWIDTSSKPYVSRSYINGSWEVVGGGVTDYNDIKNKPTINGVELDGNKTSQELGVYSKPSGGIPQSDLSSDVQSQLNKHFKGWYDSDSNLPANPVVGDYAYVKGATSTDPAAIYECTTAGSWSDSGRTADTSNVQTFKTGEAINQTSLIDDVALGEDEDIPSCKYGKSMYDEYQKQNNRLCFDFEDLSQLEFRGDLKSNEAKIVVFASTSPYQDAYYIIPIQANDYINIVRNDNIASGGYFLKSFTFSKETRNLIVVDGGSYMNCSTKNSVYKYYAPADAKWLIIRSKSSNGVDQTPKVLTINGVDINKSYSKRLDEDLFNSIEYNTFTAGLYTSDGSSNTNANFKRTLVDINEGDKITTNYSAESSHTYVYFALFDDSGDLVRSFRPVINYTITKEDWDSGARKLGVSYRLAATTVDNSPYLKVVKNYGKVACNNVSEVDTRVSKMVIQLQNLNNFFIETYNEGIAVKHVFLRYSKIWDSLEYLDGDGETQIATSVTSADYWDCHDIKYNNEYIIQGNTNFITSPLAPIGVGGHIGSQHGLEVTKYQKFLADGKEFSPVVANTKINCDCFKWIVVSDIYQSDGGRNTFGSQKPKLDTSGNPVVLFEHFMEVTINRDNTVIVDNKLLVKQNNVSFLSCDAAMQDVNFGDFSKVIISGGAKTYINEISDEGVLTAVGGSDLLEHEKGVYGNKVEYFGKGFYVSQEIEPKFSGAICNIFPFLYEDRMKCYLYPVLCQRSPSGTTPEVFNIGDVIATRNTRHILLSNSIEEDD